MKKKKKSSIIGNIDYDATSKTLTITFTTGATYTYSKVSQRVYNNLTMADSQGMYFHQHIRDKYETKKVEADD